jgi:hypothetical protein
LKAAADADAVVAIAKGAGFFISAEELKKAQAEVSEEELEGVAGAADMFNFSVHVACGALSTDKSKCVWFS